MITYSEIVQTSNCNDNTKKIAKKEEEDISSTSSFI